MRALAIAFVGGLLALVAAAPASATEVFVDGTTLRIVDRAQDPNTLDVHFNGLTYVVYDDYSRLAVARGDTCAAVDGRRHRVACMAMAILALSIDTGDGADVVLLSDIPDRIEVTVKGGPDDDLIVGGSGGDDLDGGPGDDAVIGGSGDDTIAGTDGNDFLRGGEGTDTMSGGADADILEGQAGNLDVLEGDGGPDLLRGGAGNDKIYGGVGEDVLVTDTGLDVANTGEGDDRVFGTAGDVVGECGPGDLVRTGDVTPRKGCTHLPSTETVPKAWPPLLADPTAARSTVRAARIVIDPPRIKRHPRVVRSKRIITLQALSKQHTQTEVTVRTYAKKKPQGKPLHTYRATIWTDQPKPIAIKGSGRVLSARVSLRG